MTRRITPQPARGSFYLKPNVYARKVNDLATLKQEERDHIVTKLNEQLRAEILDAIGLGRPGLAKLVKTIEIDYRELLGTDLQTVVKDEVLPQAARHPDLAGEVTSLDAGLQTIPSIGIGALLHLDAAIRDHPVFAKAFRREKALAFAKLIKLQGNLATKFADKDLTLEDANDATLEPLVREHILTKDQKADLLLTVDLNRLAGENIALIRALKTDRLKSLEDFISWDASQWAKVLRGARVPLAEGEDSIESYAENLRENIEQTFPTQYLLTRVITKKHDAEIKAVGSVNVLLKKNDRILSGGPVDPQQLNWTGITAENKKRITQDLEVVFAITNTYRHLGIAALVNDKQLTGADKTAAIAKRLGALDTFYKNNPYVDLHEIDFLAKDVQFNWAGIEPADRPKVRKQLMAYQRTLHLGQDAETSLALLRKGFDCAMDISGTPEDDFRAISGLDLEKSRRIYVRAQNQAVATTHFLEAIRDALFGSFKELAVSNMSPLVNDLREIDGFDALFGKQNFCDCEECKSILSPAAYFADLMYFVQEHVSKRAFQPGHANHPLYLKNRRPDLWTLQLTCRNTKTEIPYLEVVNDVLEQYLKTEGGIADVYDMLQQSDLSCTLPFHLPIQELRTYLGHFEVSLWEIYKVLKEPPDTQRREKLKMTDAELQIVLTANPADANKRFGNPATLANFNVQEFVRLAALTRLELDDLLKVRFLPEIAQVTVDIHKYNEVLKNLTSTRLDVIHRFLRFRKHTPWTIRECDLVLSALKEAGLVNTLEHADAGSPAVLKVADLISIQEALQLTAEELCAMAGELPRTPSANNQKSLYERMFDLEKLFGVAAVASDGTKTYNSQAILPADKTQDTKTPLLLAGLGINASELVALLVHLGIDTTVNVQIDIALLSKLFRHARVARGLRFSIEDLIAASALRLSGAALTQLGQILDLVEFEAWLRASPFTVAELALILLGRESSACRYANDTTSVTAAVLEIQASDQTDKKALLKSYLQRAFSVTAKQLNTEFLASLVSTSIDGTGVATALTASFSGGKPDNPSDLDGLMQLFREFDRLDLLFRKLRFDADAITYWIQNRTVFGIADLKRLGFGDIRNAVFYRALVESNPELEARVRDVLVAFQAGGAFTPDDVKVLADLRHRPEREIRSIVESLALTPPSLEAVRFLLDAQQVSQRLGIEGHSLQKLRATDYPELQAARDIAFGAFASKYENEKTRCEKLEPYVDKIHTLKRDALCDYIIARRDIFKFNDRSDLYAFFLLDTQMSGCFRTSRVVAAITSVQLYVHRCLMNLEQSDKVLNPGIVDLNVYPAWIPADEWAWRQNYRVWEANRKVFVYPENYLDPTLRNDKTPLFRELEEELLQEKITKETAEAAYKKYVARFAELTELRYAGAYYHRVPSDFAYVDLSALIREVKREMYMPVSGLRVQGSELRAFLTAESEESVYYLFARTNVQPYQYFFRTYNHYKRAWDAWKKVDLAIDADEVSVLMHTGKLYIYWTEVQSKEINKVSGGNAQGKGVVFKVFLKYSFLDEAGKWASPQRISVGFTHSTEEHIYQRVQGLFPSDEDEREQKHDHVFEQYQRKVFRKPYARLDDDVQKPIAVSYIWSQNVGVPWVRYEVQNQLLHLAPGIVVNIPSTQFLITNNQFPATNTVVVSGTFQVGGFGSKSFTGSATITLLSAGFCACSLTKINNSNLSDLIDLPAPLIGSVEVRTLDPPREVYASWFGLSLGKNDIIEDPDQELLDIATKRDRRLISDSALASLKEEYDMAFAENGDYAHYVEDGTHDFTDTKRMLAQFASGYGQLSIELSDGSLDPVPLTTILTDELSAVLQAKGVEQFLGLKTQQMTDRSGSQFDFTGPYGAYYWEMFCHIPFLLASHLNANQQFKEARWWYERIFNPCADESPATGTRPTDRNWQYREFRNVDIQKLKDILSDEAAIDAYKKDPFNPHVIARLRLTAYQKAVVMRYIDNLIDWGDHLFAQDSRESINQAEMLYQLAADILGRRPVKLGGCETVHDQALTYERIGPAIGEGSEFLVALEHVYLRVRNRDVPDVKAMTKTKHLDAVINHSRGKAKPTTFAAVREAATMNRVSEVIAKWQLPPNSGARRVRGSYHMKYHKQIVKAQRAHKTQGYEWADANAFTDNVRIQPVRRYPSSELAKQSTLVFCVPPNVELLKYWDRVDDRLFKIRNCMNISGIRRSLALFQPPIDAMMLLRISAAGLSLEDVMGAVVSMPPYRFSYLLEKCRQFTQTVQGFGGALLSALEKKDVEELTLLRSVHERNILRLTKDVRKKQLKEAQYQYQAMSENLANVQNRIDYYQGLVSDGLTEWEVTQQTAKHTSSTLQVYGSLRLIAGLDYLIPQVGSAFAMTYGGKQRGDSASSFAEVVASAVKIAEAISDSAGLEATFQRREQEWRQQLTLAKNEFKQVEKLVLAAEIRKAIAEKDMDIHEKNIEQGDELHDFYRNKLTNLGLYQYLASTLNRLYRDAYNAAFDMAKMAEFAYQFEIDGSAFFITGDNWRADRAGLLAGERLLLQLQKMEQAYLQNNVRIPEITQSFSLALLDAEQLVQLRHTGWCTIRIPEVAFEVFYPGQYRRLIRSVSVTVPCVAGPYSNVGARLTLMKSWVETEDKAGLTEVRVGMDTSITTSNGTNDAGLFEFNYRDERYLPFEGAGAISEWRLELPSQLRSFNYDTIADLILHISYTAKEGDRAAAENALATAITNHAASQGLIRLFSLKHEFPNALYQLLNPAAGAPQRTGLEVEKQHFPYLLTDRGLRIVETRVFLKPKHNMSVNRPATLNVNGTNAVVWDATVDIAMPGSVGETNKLKAGTVTVVGAPTRTWTVDAGIGGLDPNTLDDILILIKYQIE